MSDENLVNLEDDTPDPAPAAPPEPPPAEAAAPPAEPEALDPEDPEILKDERRLKAVLAETARIRRELREVKPLAQKAQEYEQWVQQHRPYVEFLQQNPDFLRRPAAPEPVKPPEPQVDEAAVALARTLDLYTPDGQPDTKKAQQIRSLFRQEAQQVTQQAVEPYEERILQAQTNQNFQEVLNFTHNGVKPAEQAVRAIYQQLLSEPGGLRITADPRMKPIIAMWALGATQLTQKPAPAPPTKEPVVSESLGATPPAAKISPLEERIIGQRGMTAQKWQELTKGYRPGHTTIIEDD